MYDSLKSWINIPAKYRKLLTYDSGGNKSYGDYVDFYCYPEGYNSVVKDLAGNSKISNQRLFVDALENISIGDEITLDGVIYEARSTAPFYRNGEKDLLVVYI